MSGVYGALLVLQLYVVTSGHKMANNLPPSYTDQMQQSRIVTCAHTETECEFVLTVKEWLTMYRNNKPVYIKDGFLFELNVKNGTSTRIAKEAVATADGSVGRPRKVFLFNGTFPGPTLEVYKGQRVTVHVRNQLLSEVTSIHWHGLHMVGAPHSDGVPYVTQCPIMPGQLFTYQFTVNQEPGAFWYHSHVAVQRSNGLSGAFIIKDRPIPNFAFPPEHVVMVQEWNHDMDPSMNYLKMFFGFYRGTPPDLSMWMGNEDIGGAKNGMFDFHSGLINGRGRFYSSDKTKHNSAPLSDFLVKSGEKARFRLINSAAVFPFKISIDNHPLTIVASDGHFIEPVTAHSVIVAPGERFDIIIKANQTVANYWIRAETLEVGVNHTTEAILHYEGAPEDQDPASTDYSCTRSSPCRVLNCHFRCYPENRYQECIHADQMRFSSEQDYSKYLRLLDTGTAAWPRAEPKQMPKPTKQLFLNFGFPGEDWSPGSVNGRHFLPPPTTVLTDLDAVRTLCSANDECGDDKVCKCTAVETVEYDDEVQIVLTNHGSGSGYSHPVHLHGHHFTIVKLGLGTYNNKTGLLLAQNADVDCRTSSTSSASYCNYPTWSDRKWLDLLPGSLGYSGPMKDTVTVPSGGYVVVRFRADNPGAWALHCHVDVHSSDGMFVVIAEARDRWPEAPSGFPRCGSYDPEEMEPQDNLSGHPGVREYSVDSVSYVTFRATLGCMCIVCIVLLVALISTCCTLRKAELKDTHTYYFTR